MEKEKKNSFFSWLSFDKEENKILNQKEKNPNKYTKEKPSIKTVIEIQDNDLEKNNNFQTIQQKENNSINQNFFIRLKKSLIRTRENIGFNFINLLCNNKINEELFEQLEEKLLISDIGIKTTCHIMNKLKQTNHKQLKDTKIVYNLLKNEMIDILNEVNVPLQISNESPFIILIIGVNGVGKTTTIGKLTHHYQKQGKSIMLAAGDTFRAAAIDQLQIWGQRNNIPVIAKHNNADSASVIFEAMQTAKSRKFDILIADTAGRLHNKSFLLEELKKIIRVMKKIDKNTPHEIMLILDSCTGQNAINQVKLFHEAVKLTGITITKLDGTAKGGIIFSIAEQFKIPIRYIGIGEGIEDLRPFNAEDFIKALFI
ncbi:signal recognition particle-docking protein FtsY [Pantoea sp. Aalb]|nr:signal recognition particle-docking protein FtsY [Pantoea sp. Aalb]MXP67788.1 signal recognition particle-docking protein FtsY [Pantoea sp. Aalb]